MVAARAPHARTVLSVLQHRIAIHLYAQDLCRAKLSRGRCPYGFYAEVFSLHFSTVFADDVRCLKYFA